MIFLTNAFSLSMISDFSLSELRIRKLDISEVRDMLLENEFVSAIGHKSTSEVLSKLLGIEIPMSRIMVKLNEDNKILVFQLMVRIEEGKVLDENEIRNLPYEFYEVELIRYRDFEDKEFFRNMNIGGK